MPLIDVTLYPGHRLEHMFDTHPFTEGHTYVIVKERIPQELIRLIFENLQELGLNIKTPAEGIQVMSHDFNKHDVNVPGIWIAFQFSEDRPELEERLRIRDVLYGLVCGLLQDAYAATSNSLVIDLFWGSTNGRGVVNGTKIEW